MRYATIRTKKATALAIVLKDGVLPVKRLARHARAAHPSGPALPSTMEALIASGDEAVRSAFDAWSAAGGTGAHVLPLDSVCFLAPYLRPGKLWGIGLNYRDHATDLDEAVPTEPASFMRPATSIIGPGDAIELPPASRRVTAEAELALIIGKRVRDVDVAGAADAVFGYTLVIDVTAEDILRRNPRFLTRAKSFDTFFSFGPWIVTPDEVDHLEGLTVTTGLNGQTRRSNVVGNMTYPPLDLLSFHSRNMTWEPGDILSTGTPGAVVVEDGDVAYCEIKGLGRLENPVVRRG